MRQLKAIRSRCRFYTEEQNHNIISTCNNLTMVSRHLAWNLIIMPEKSKYFHKHLFLFYLFPKCYIEFTFLSTGLRISLSLVTGTSKCYFHMKILKAIMYTSYIIKVTTLGRQGISMHLHWTMVKYKWIWQWNSIGWEGADMPWWPGVMVLNKGVNLNSTTFPVSWLREHPTIWWIRRKIIIK